MKDPFEANMIIDNSKILGREPRRIATDIGNRYLGGERQGLAFAVRSYLG